MREGILTRCWSAQLLKMILKVGERIETVSNHFSVEYQREVALEILSKDS